MGSEHFDLVRGDLGFSPRSIALNSDLGGKSLKFCKDAVLYG